MKSKTITKTFETRNKAAHYQTRLYSQYDQVRLVKSPVFSEQGTYTWQVANSLTS